LLGVEIHAIRILQTAQAEAEEMYLSQEAPKITLLGSESDGEEDQS